MSYHPEINDYIISKNTAHIYKVVDVNNSWGWFVVKDEEGKEHTFRINRKGSYTFFKLTPEQFADYMLELERAGITDYWRDYEG